MRVRNNKRACAIHPTPYPGSAGIPKAQSTRSWISISDTVELSVQNSSRQACSPAETQTDGRERTLTHAPTHTYLHTRSKTWWGKTVNLSSQLSITSVSFNLWLFKVVRRSSVQLDSFLAPNPEPLSWDICYLSADVDRKWTWFIYTLRLYIKFLLRCAKWYLLAVFVVSDVVFYYHVWPKVKSSADK